MARSGGTLKHVFLATLLMSCLLKAHAVSAQEAKVEAQGNQQYANVNESGLSVSSSALLTFLLTQNGVGVDLGVGFYGNGTTAITLPTGISVINILAPIGGCGFTYTQWFSWPDGQYGMRVVPFTGNPTCKSVAGDYTFHVKVDLPGYKGQALGVLTIK